MSNRRLRWTLEDNGSFARLEGDVDEFADLPGLAEQLQGSALQLDLGGVRRINSLGLRNWLRWLQLLAGRSITFLRCSPSIVEQLSAIKDFRGHATVKSVLLPYVCERCEARELPEVVLSTLHGTTELPPAPQCPNCHEAMVLDDFPERYLTLARS